MREIDGRRSKKKDKFREKKKHPYKSGGRFRVGNVKLRDSQQITKKKKN